MGVLGADPAQIKPEGEVEVELELQCYFRGEILHERREHARGRNLADCKRICGSPC